MRLPSSINFSSIKPELLLLLIFLAPLPSFFSHFTLSKFFNPVFYTAAAGLRELILLMIGFNMSYMIFTMLWRKYDIYSLVPLLFPVFALFSIFYYFIDGTQSFQLIFIGLRFFILMSLPFALYLSPPRITNKHKSILLIVCIVYLLMSFLCFTLGFNGYPPYYGSTFLGPRFGFVYEYPITTARTFAAISIFLYLLILETISIRFRALYFLLITLFVLMSLFTGGRSGLLILFLALSFSSVSLVFPSFHSKYLCPRKFITKIFFLSGFAIFSLPLLRLVSDVRFSGRESTSDQLSQGLVAGVFGSRLDILFDAFNASDFFEYGVGIPGLGTNVGATFSGTALISDSYLASSFLSFGIPGLSFVVFTFILLFLYCDTLLIPLAFVVFTISQSLPEVIMVWTLLTFCFAMQLESRRRFQS